MGWSIAWPVRSISARGRPACAAARLTVSKKSGALIRLEHEAMTSLPPGASTLKVDPCEAEKAFALPLISVED